MNTLLRLTRLAVAGRAISLPAVLFLLTLLAAAPASRAQTCSGSGCNGVNPLAAGCTGDGVMLDYRSLTADNGLILGYVYLMNSPTCQTVWTEVSASWENSSMAAEITSGGLSYGASGSGLAVLSPMIYDPTPSGSYGFGSVSVSATTIFGCPPYESGPWEQGGGYFEQCSSQTYYAGGNVYAP